MDAGDWLGEGVFYQAPLYPYFLAILQSLFGHNLWAIRFVQLLLGSLSCGLIFLAGDKLFSRAAGLAAGLILACYAPAIFFDVLIEKSILDFFLISCLLFLLIGRVHDEKWGRWLVAGMVSGLLGLSRENALVLVPVIALWLAISFTRTSLQLRARWLGLYLAGVLLILLPVGLRNFAKGGEFQLTTSQLGPNFFIGNNAAADGTYGSVRKAIQEAQLEGPDAKRLAERRAGRTLTPGQVSDYWLDQAVLYIRNHPADWLRLLAAKWLMVWNKREIEDSDDFYIYQSWSGLLGLLGAVNHFGVLAPLFMAGLVLTVARWRNLWLLYAMILSMAASVAIFYVFGRYRFPLVPLMAPIAGVGLIEMAKLFKNKRWPRLAIALIVAACAAVLVNWPLGGSGPGAAGYNNLANAYLKQGRVGEATRTALKALEVDPEYGVGHYNLGNLFAQQGKFDLAQRHFEAAIRLYPNYADAHSNYGQLIAVRGDLEIGIQYFKRAIELNPTLSRAHLNLGVALAKQEKFDQAIQPLQRAAELMPVAPEATYYLGSVYAAQGRYGEAANAFAQALANNPGFAPAHQSLAQLLTMQGKTTEAAAHYHEARRLMKQR